MEYNYNLIQYTFQQTNMSTFSINTFTSESSSYKYKKYSLRDRHQKRNPIKNDRETSFNPNHQEERKQEFLRTGGDRHDLKQQLSLLASTFLDNSTFNLPQSHEANLEFNRVASVKVIKTQKYIQEPIASSSMLKIASNSTLINKRQENPTVQFSHISKPFESSNQYFFANKNSQNGQFKMKNSAVFQNSREEIITEPWKSNKNKFSLRKSNPLASTRSQFRVCLCYSDIRFPLRPSKSEQLREMYQCRQILQKRQNQNKFAKFLCNQLIRFGKYGCTCEPKCHWINRWLNRAQYQEFKNSQTIIPPKDWQATAIQIEKDIPRTQVTNETFLQEEYRQRLREVLIGYCKIDWETGYVQGMNVVASVIVYHSTGSYEALKVMELLMRQMNLRQVYASDLSFGSRVALVLVEQLKRLTFDLYSHLLAQGVDIKLFATSWYLSLLGAFVPLEWMHCVVEKFMRRGWSGINEIILAMVLLFKEQLMARDAIEIMEVLSCKQLQMRAAQIDWSELIIRSDNILLPQFQS